MQAAQYIYQSITTSTRQTYSSRGHQFICFCLFHKLISLQNPFQPAHESTLIHFVTHLCNTITYGTIKFYLAAVRNLHLDFGCPRIRIHAFPLQNPKGDQILSWHFEASSVPHYHLYPRPNLCHIKPYIPLLLAAFTLASLFFCGANSLVMAILTFSPVLPGPISRSNPTFSIQSILLLPFQETAKFTIAKSIWNVCAVTALQDYLLQTLHHEDRQPLFQFANGHNLTWTALTNNLPGLLHVCGLDSTHYASHSFKIEAATTVGAAGICDWLIKVLARRKSDAYQSSRLLKRHYFKSHRTWLQALCTNDFPLSLRTL